MMDMSSLRKFEHPSFGDIHLEAFTDQKGVYWFGRDPIESILDIYGCKYSDDQENQSFDMFSKLQNRSFSTAFMTFSAVRKMILGSGGSRDRRDKILNLVANGVIPCLDGDIHKMPRGMSLKMDGKTMKNGIRRHIWLDFLAGVLTGAIVARIVATVAAIVAWHIDG
jgi:hypothetical protein